MKTNIINHLTEGKIAVPMQRLLDSRVQSLDKSLENYISLFLLLMDILLWLKDSAFHCVQDKWKRPHQALINIPHWLYDEMRKYQQGKIRE